MTLLKASQEILSSSLGPRMSRLLALGFISLFALSCTAQEPEPNKSHHTEDGFRNIHPHRQHGLWDLLRWRWNRLWKDNPSPEDYAFPLANNDPAFLKSNPEKTTLTWIGHATVLLRLAGKNILTDPHYSERASPVQWAGPKRVVAPGLPFEALPPIDIVVISHDHYDSLDKQTVIKLKEREGGQETTFFVPLGLRSWFEDLGIRQVVELDWWEEHAEEDLRITAVPVQHWSKRGLFARNQTLWAGWVVQSEGFRFFFAGDSGYTPHFEEIGQRLGPFDLTAIPIGAYEPRWFMRPYHVSPEEAVQAHLDLRSRKSVAIHWGTFILTDEPLDEPPERLERAKKAKGLSEEEFVVLKHGETIVIN
jgi:N-acyl-phosphatidylethanolamine-hydrolysing phospholipase D